MSEPQNARKLNCLNRLRTHYGDVEGRKRYKIIKEIVHDVAINGPFPQSLTVSPALKAHITGSKPDVAFRCEVNHCLAKAGVPLKPGDAPKVAKAVMKARSTKDKALSLRSQLCEIFEEDAVRHKAYEAVKLFL